MTALWASCLLLGLWLMTTELNHGALKCYAGAVSCDEGYLQVGGECRRYLWTEEEANRRIGITEGFPLARPGDANLAVCVTIKPLHFTSIAIDLYNEDCEITVSHFHIRMRFKRDHKYDNSIVINEAWNNRRNWGNEKVYYPTHYPFSLGRETTVKFVASSYDTLTYLVNWVGLDTRRLRRSLTEVAKVVVTGDAIITRVNVWCK